MEGGRGKRKAGILTRSEEKSGLLYRPKERGNAMSVPGALYISLIRLAALGFRHFVTGAEPSVIASILQSLPKTLVGLIDQYCAERGEDDEPTRLVYPSPAANDQLPNNTSYS